MRIRAIALDLDGTLLNAQKQVSPRNLAAVLACHRMGLRIIVATARPPRSVKQLLPPELLDAASAIYYNGAWLRYEGLNRQLGLTEELARRIAVYFRERCPDAMLCYEWEDRLLSDRLPDAEHIELLGLPEDGSEPEVLRVEGGGGRHIAKLLLSNPDEIYEQLEACFGQEAHVLLTDNRRLIQIMHPEASKERALALLLEAMHVSPEEVMAFGDDMNDLGMFRLCGYPVAMSNAVEPLKRLAVRITGHHDRDGVAIVLEELAAGLSVNRSDAE